ncbi:MAG: DUF4197 domain-containing protein [Bacteroidetes bacterium]|nr:DUF4197 domain-containing protein [Bacteroidota bacterium]
MIRLPRYLPYVLAFNLFFATGCDVLSELLQSAKLPILTQDEIVHGLKEALRVGTDTAVSRLSRSDGFYKDALVRIALPKEANALVKNISKVPLIGDKMLEETRKLINRAAEDAAKEAAPIFKNAIIGMSVTDAVNILKGNDSAATHYLRGKTFDQLKKAFMPKIQASLGKKIVGNTSAEDAYKALIDKYNLAAKVPLSGLEPVKSSSLSNYVTRRALNGLFLKVALEEKDIRSDPKARVNDVLKKVFDENNRNATFSF